MEAERLRQLRASAGRQSSPQVQVIDDEDEGMRYLIELEFNYCFRVTTSPSSINWPASKFASGNGVSLNMLFNINFIDDAEMCNMLGTVMKKIWNCKELL